VIYLDVSRINVSLTFNSRQNYFIPIDFEAFEAHFHAAARDDGYISILIACLQLQLYTAINRLPLTAVVCQYK